MKIDGYLIHSLRAETSGGAFEAEGLGTTDPKADELRFPMLLRIIRTAFEATRIRDLEVIAEIQDIVACTGTFMSLGDIERDPSVLAVEASRPSVQADVAASLPFSKAHLIHRPPASEDGEHAVVAVIDESIDVLHECFLDETGKTRIMALWDQTDPTGPPPSKRGYSPGLSYGTLHTDVDIDGYVRSSVVPSRLGRDPNGHGTHVTSIAAGRAVAAFAGGMAPGARIVFVKPQLAVGRGSPRSIGYSVSHAAALSFAGEAADKLGLPVAVNVSLGMNAGAHDGSSLLEAAFDGFSEGGRREGRVIVKSAGNERRQSGHAATDVSTGVTVDLAWISSGVHSGPDNIEVWHQAADHLGFRLMGPSGETSSQVDWITPHQSGRFATGEKYDVTLDRWFQDNGDSRLLVTISSSHFISNGRFELEIEGKSVVTDGHLNAWIERDNSRPIKFDVHVDEEGTLSIPGTARTVVTVASIEFNPAVRSSSFSSQGPARDGRAKPDLSAPGDNIEAAKSGTPRGTCTMSGTSMATPHVTGAVALLLSRQKRTSGSMPNAVQVGSMLRGTASNRRAQHSPALGFGTLDAEAFFNAW